MAPRSEREEAISALANKLLASMIDDLVLDTALQAHHEVSKSRAVCAVCNTHCNSVHVPKPSSAMPPTAGTPSSAGTPAASTESPKIVNGSASNGANTPTSIKGDGTLLLDCAICKRPIAHNRYAPHLSSCMGLPNARRGAVRSNVKSKQPSEADRSTSPNSDLGNISDDKAKKLTSKSKRADEAEFSFKRKRPGSPQISPNKGSPTKKQKAAKPSGSLVSRVKATSDASLARSSVPPIPNSQSKIPSKLRDSSTASFLERSSTTSSRSSSPAVTPVSSSFSHSPSVAARPNGKVKGTGPPQHIPRGPSPTRPPPVSHYMLDDDAGNETGSSTDTDSS